MNTSILFIYPYFPDAKHPSILLPTDKVMNGNT